MKLFQGRTNETSPQSCAREILDTIPHVMRSIRAEMRRGRKPDMSIPQFRTLAFLKHYPDSSLSQLAEILGLSLPSVSKIVDGLVERNIVTRRSSAKDRRRIKLSLTDQGRARFNAARQATQTRLAELVECLSEAELASVIEGMQRLRPVFESTSRKSQVPAVARKNI